MSYLQFITGLFLGALIGALAWRARALTASGAWAAALTGGLLYGLGGLPWAALLLAFFLSSSALSRLFGRRKQALAEKFSKGARRDWAQVAANGGLGVVCVIFHALLPEQAWPWVAFAGSMAAVNADTWGTELGVLSGTPPRLITTGQPVERGTSGGLTPLGTAASLAGAAFIGLGFAAFSQGSGLFALGSATLGGLAGALFDSFLGATAQAIYHCPACAKETERHPLHTCGAPTHRVRGWGWLDNDLVNLAAALTGALLTLAAWSIF